MAIERGNWMLAGALRAGKRAAAVMSLAPSTTLNGHGFCACLKGVLKRLPSLPASRVGGSLPHGRPRDLPVISHRLRSCADFPSESGLRLRCNASSDAAVARLRQSQAPELRRVGLHLTPSGAPHMTMSYDRRHAALHSIEPISWTAKRFALIPSHVRLSQIEQ